MKYQYYKKKRYDSENCNFFYQFFFFLVNKEYIEFSESLGSMLIVQFAISSFSFAGFIIEFGALVPKAFGRFHRPTNMDPYASVGTRLCDLLHFQISIFELRIY